MIIRELGLKAPITTSPFAGTDEAIELMWRHDVRHLLVVDRAGLAGLVTEGDLLESVCMLTSAERACMGAGPCEEVLVADVMEAEAVCVTPDTQLADAGRHMLYGRWTALPVVAGSCPVGIVTESDLLRLFTDPSRACRAGLDEEPVINHSARVLRTVSRTDRVRRVCEKLNGSRHRHVLVIEDGRLVGLISDADVRAAIGRSEPGEWLNFPLADIMATGVQTLRPDDTLNRAARIMCSDRIAAIPITTRDGLLLSMITVADLLRAFFAGTPVHA